MSGRRVPDAQLALPCGCRLAPIQGRMAWSYCPTHAEAPAMLALLRELVSVTPDVLGTLHVRESARALLARLDAR